MALTKSTLTTVQEWVQIAVASQLEVEYDCSLGYESVLNLIVAHDSTNAHANGVRVTFEERVGSVDEGWRQIQQIRLSGGTAVQVNVDVECAAAATQLKVDSTGGSSEFETMGDKYFCKNTVIANSEVVINNGFADNDYITCLNGLSLTQETTTDVFNIVREGRFPIPFASNRARLIIWNDDADCTVCVKVDASRVTALT